MTSRRKPSTQTNVPRATLPGETPSEEARTEEDMQEKFERELCWCTEQLSTMLSDMDPNKRQYKDKLKALQTLENPKAPMIKKRQVMSAALGNYRQQMEAEQAKYNTDMQNRMKLEVATGSQATFIKKVVASQKIPAEENGFMFNFVVNEESLS
uniref:Uncharacterized protein n=1 Tax=Ornithodoros turicata TaxID=34597 RepID=A0A2R5LGN2_9ACAR